MKRLAFALGFVLMCFGFSSKAVAQYYFYDDSYYDKPVIFELGASLGAMNCLTDIGGKAGIGKKFVKDLNYGETNSCVGGYLSILYKNAIGLSLAASFGKLSGDDNLLASVPVGDIARTRYNRQLNFQTSITEFSGVVEMYPLFLFIDWENRDAEPPRYSPYLLGGIGYYSFNPQAKIGNKLIDLQPLSTEGQGLAEYPDRKVYSLKQVNFPVGAGFKYELSSLINLRGEFVYRILTTDYLDDVSTNYIDPTFYTNNGFNGTRLQNALLLNNRVINGQKALPGNKRGSPTQKDSYFSFNLKIGISIGRERIR
jgi:hypothetical protein